MQIRIKVTKGEVSVSAGNDDLKGTLSLGGKDGPTTIEVTGLGTLQLNPGVTCDGTLTMEKGGTGYSPPARP